MTISNTSSTPSALPAALSASTSSQIEARFPRIASAITLLWGNPEMDAYFTRIMVDERGDREGFPPEVMAEILFLANLHTNAYPFEKIKHDYANRGGGFSALPYR